MYFMDMTAVLLALTPEQTHIELDRKMSKCIGSAMACSTNKIFTRGFGVSLQLHITEDRQTKGCSPKFWNSFYVFARCHFSPKGHAKFILFSLNFVAIIFHSHSANIRGNVSRCLITSHHNMESPLLQEACTQF